ncbi:MAG: type IV toxin-antitoxin system AbiEi family antitoxin domain-containing protein [Melioribacteraceae bacterium]
MGKINQLIQQWQKGTVKTVKELSSLGYSPQALKNYTTYKWLSLLSRGAYKLYNDEVDWQGGLYCIQKKKNNTIHIGAKSALEYKGFAHYLSLGKTKVELFRNVNDSLPRWFTQQNWMSDLNLSKTSIFDYRGLRAYSSAIVNKIVVEISSPELAIMEMLYQVPKVHSFEEADLIMESLTTLRGDLLQTLLEKCNSVKVKRAFLYLSEKHNHSWLQDIDQTKIYLGSGKREIVKNGRLDKKYNITVPRENEG